MSAQNLGRALARSAARAGTTLAIEHHRATAWHSATFSGDRHELTLIAIAGEALDAWTQGLSATDLALPGHLLADLRITAQERRGNRAMLRIEGLTVAF